MAAGQPCVCSHARSPRVFLLPGRMIKSAGGIGSPWRTKRRSTSGCARSASKSVWLLMRGRLGTTTRNAPVEACTACTASSASRNRQCKYGSTASTGLPVCCSSHSRPGSSSLMSPLKRLITKPMVRARSLSDRHDKVPTRWANTPPRSISATRITGQSTFSAKPMLAMSRERRLISAGLPAPSTITQSYCASRRWCDSSTASIATVL